eukprot:gene937-249_t
MSHLRIAFGLAEISHAKDIPILDPAKFSIWEKQVAKGRKEYKICKSSRVCSNHFVNGKPTFDEPNPTLFLTESFSTKVKTHYNRSPKKSRRLEKKVETTTDSQKPASSTYVDDAEIASVSKEATIVGPGFAFEQLSRESEVAFYTGFKSTEVFKAVFRHLQPTASCMQYWKKYHPFRGDISKIFF